MSANNCIKIIHTTIKRWDVLMMDADTESIYQIYKARSLRGAIKIANSMVEETEYGIRKIEI